MTLRSRLSSIAHSIGFWLERKDDFPPAAPIRSEADYADELRAVSRPSMADEVEATRLEQDAEAVVASPESGSRAIHTERSRPAAPNIEFVKTPGIRRRKKLVSVPKE